MNADVIIVGAGAAGIAAAIELQSTNLTFVILEARDRIGGRAYTDRETFAPTRVDLGASWIHSYGPQNILYSFHQSLKSEDTERRMRGTELCLDYDGKRFSHEAIFQARDIYLQIDEHIESYRSSKEAKEDQSIQQIMQAIYDRLVPNSGPVKRLVDLYLSGSEQYDAADFAQLSGKQWGVGAADGGDFWVPSGYGNLIERIAEKHNLPIELNTLVTRIDTTDPERIEITTLNNSSKFYCRRVIITIPLGCLKRETITFQPPLPDWKRQAIDQMGMGLMNKLIIQFPVCFWNEKVASFVHACNERRGRFRFALCLPPPANILIFLVAGSFAHELEVLSDTETIEQIMKFLRQIFPEKTIPDPIHYRLTRWAHDPLSYGSYSYFSVNTGPHTIELLARETSDGRVQWAGEHANIDDGTHQWSYACVHSAFQSGQRAAKTIRSQLCTT
ncbi:unnamed protein product [Adineta ricciae]|uniref:Amine oxidase n=1 Tax=Adineta ricciae TaxID=249248 RepID=A0A816CX56_ADIRI|nr:unnamed protein product [Adineta ricciae]